jgi:hypothetical protein
VRCAVEIQRGMAERNVDVPAERRICGEPALLALRLISCCNACRA